MSHSTNQAGHRFRADIQGLRGLAVLVVVSDHVLAQPRGGFLGVDVFFVVSGFVITAQLLREREQTGRVSLSRFWWRRGLRLLPTLVTVLATTTAVIAVTVPGLARSVASDALASFVSLANWRFIAKGTDYFGALESASPLQHTWSLSVEEQFYVVWPLLLSLTLWASGRGRHDRGRLPGALPVLLIGVAGLSASVCIAVATAEDGTTSYFSTATRAWELLAGALVAVAARRCRPLSDGIVARIVVSVGIAALLVSFVVVDSSVPAPVPAAVGVVGGTCLLLVAGHVTRVRHVLGWRPLVRIGDVSYPLYLWHLPVLVLVEGVSPANRWLVLPLTAALTLLTHVLVERPFREVGRRGAVRAERRPSARRSLVTVAVAATLTITMLTAAGVIHEPARPVRVASEPQGPGPASRALNAELAAALASSSWPSELATADAALDGVRECADRESVPSLEACTFGEPGAKRTAVLVGDSIAAAWLEALVPLVEQRPGWRLVALPRNGCPFVDLELDHAPHRGCSRIRAEVLQDVERLHPDVAFVSSRDSAVFRGPDGSGTASDDQVARAAARAHRALHEHAGSVVLLTAPPRGADLRACRTTVGAPADCIEAVHRDRRGSADWERSSIGAEGTVVVDTTPLVTVDGLTPAFVDHIALRIDTEHLSPALSRRASPALAEVLRDAGVTLDALPGG